MLGSTVTTLRQAAGKPVLNFCLDYAQPEQVQDALLRAGADGLVARPFFLSGLCAAPKKVRAAAPTDEEPDSSILRGMRFLCAEGNAFSEDIQRSLAAGMDAHISKPIDIDVLERTLRGFVTPHIRERKAFVHQKKPDMTPDSERSR